MTCPLARCLLPAVAALALGLTACGGGDSSADGGAAEPPATGGSGVILDILRLDGRYLGTAKQARASEAGALPAENDAPAPVTLADSQPLAEIVLEPLAQAGEPLSTSGRALRIGTQRAVAATATADALQQQWQWTQAEDGRLHAAIRFTAQEAQGVRLGILVEHIPADAELHFYDRQNRQALFSASGAGIHATLERNRATGDASEAASTWWSPRVAGDSLILEAVLPAGASPAELRVAIAQLSHLFADPEQAWQEWARQQSASQSTGAGKAAFTSCMIDAVCQNTGTAQRDAVVRLLYEDTDGAYLCTGTLLNDAAASDTPYILTANHCVNSQTIASTIETDWFYRSSACDSIAIDQRAVTLRGGARLLLASDLSTGTDATLLALNGAVPQGAYFAGWDANQTAANATVFSIHHPDGEPISFSQGILDGYAIYDSIGFSSSDAAAGRFHRVLWQQGITAVGGSGAALFSASGHVLGSLYGGLSSCSAPGAPDYYGRFDLSFTQGMNRYLAAGG